MSHHPALVRAYLENALAALAKQQTQEAAFLAQHAFELLMPAASSSSLSPARFSYGVGLDTGIKRSGRPNEDYAFATSFRWHQASGGLFVVADGMGGHANGADASHLAVHTAVDFLLPHLMSDSLPEEHISALLAQGVQEANRAVFFQNRAHTIKTQAMMGTTITMAISLGKKLYIANVGDSRTYILRRGKPLHQITRDHSVVAGLLALGHIRPEEVYTHPRRNEILQCLGHQEQVEVDIFSEVMEDGDMVLLCSDGLWEMLPEVKMIEEVLSTPWLSVERMTERLVHLARCAGGHDNIGVVVMQARFPDVQDMPTMIISPEALASVTVPIQQVVGA